MLLGKRPRVPIMRRTRSMSGGMAIDTQPNDTNNLEPHHEELMSDPSHALLLEADQTNNNMVATVIFPASPTSITSITVCDTTNNHTQTQTQNPTNNVNLIQHTPHFLRTCRLCTSPLAPGRDIYMYRGDTAFCSLECREKQIKQDQRKEKWKMGSNKGERGVISPPPNANANANAKSSSTKSQTAAACN